MASPIPSTMTPGISQVLPDWAHPTPSPSLMVRYPDPHAWHALPSRLEGQGGNAGAGSGTAPGQQAATTWLEGAAESPQPALLDLLMEVCNPLYRDMMKAVEAVLQREIESRLKQQGKPAEPTKASVGAAQGNAFRGYHEIPFGSFVRGDSEQGAKRYSVVSVPEEESSSEEEEEDASKGQQFSALFGESHDAPQAASHSSESFESAPEENAEGDERPVYLSWSSPAQTSTVPPSLMRTMTPPAVSPVARAMMPQPETRVAAAAAMLSSCPAAAASGSPQAAAAAGAVAMDAGSTSSPSKPLASKHVAGTAGPAHKCAVVCRHWKSKGWCRMGEECKFAHPEHKRGVGAVQAPAGQVQGQPVLPTSEAKAKAAASQSRGPIQQVPANSQQQQQQPPILMVPPPMAAAVAAAGQSAQAKAAKAKPPKKAPAAKVEAPIVAAPDGQFLPPGLVSGTAQDT